MGGAHRFSRLAVLGLVWGLAVGAGGGAWANSEPSPEMNRVSLQTQSSRAVPNDLMRVVLAAQGEDQDPAKLADSINRTMGWALERARATEGVRVRSGGYQIFPVHEEGRVVRWRATQQLVLESGDSDRVMALVGELQSRLQVSSLEFSVSPQARREAEDELIDSALDLFKRRAEIVRRNLDASRYRIVEISIQASGGRPWRPLPRMRAMRTTAAAVTPPATEAGSSQVSMSVSGTIQLD